MSKVILVIDDSYVNREIMKDYIEDVGDGFEVICAAGGSEGLDILRQLNENNAKGNNPSFPVCIFLDIQMPDMNGYETARAIRVLGGKYEKVDIIAMSAGDTREDMEQAYESGMDKYLVKPVNMESLCDIIKEYS